MSELVEKVQDAIFKAYDFNGIATEKMSRAAILAVAEWIAETEERECYPLETLRAELERLRGEK